MARVKKLSKAKVIDLDHYARFIKVFKKYEELLDQIPKNLYFPMFDINCWKVKTNIEKKIEDCMILLLKTLQDNIIMNMKQLNDKYSEIARHLQNPVTTAKEVEEMEKFKYDLNMEEVNLHARSSLCFEKVCFLAKYNL